MKITGSRSGESQTWQRSTTMLRPEPAARFLGGAVIFSLYRSGHLRCTRITGFAVNTRLRFWPDLLEDLRAARIPILGAWRYRGIAARCCRVESRRARSGYSAPDISPLLLPMPRFGFRHPCRRCKYSDGLLAPARHDSIDRIINVRKRARLIPISLDRKIDHAAFLPDISLRNRSTNCGTTCSRPMFGP